MSQDRFTAASNDRYLARLGLNSRAPLDAPSLAHCNSAVGPGGPMDLDAGTGPQHSALPDP